MSEERTPTPRTDAALRPHGSPFGCVDYAFARQLERELEEAERLYSELSTALVGDKLLPPLVEVARLQRELVEARKDAERYRQLRRGQKWSVINGIGVELRAEALDAAIDFAIENTSSPQGKG